MYIAVCDDEGYERSILTYPHTWVGATTWDGLMERMTQRAQTIHYTYAYVYNMDAETGNCVQAWVWSKKDGAWIQVWPEQGKG